MERRLVRFPALEVAAAVAKDLTDRGLASDLTLTLDAQAAVLSLQPASQGRSPSPRVQPHVRTIWSQFVFDGVEATREHVFAVRNQVATTRAWIEQNRRALPADRPLSLRR